MNHYLPLTLWNLEAVRWWEAQYLAYSDLRKDRDNLKQRKVQQSHLDDLSQDLSDAIRDLFNRRVTNKAEYKQWKTDFKDWCREIGDKVESNFSRSDRIHFDRLGGMPKNAYGQAFNQKHNHYLIELDMKFNRLREIIRDNRLKK